MNKTFLIMTRECMETIKSRTFLASLLLTPILIGAMTFVSSRAEKSIRQTTRPTRTIVIADRSPGLGSELKKALTQYNTANANRKLTFVDAEPESGLKPIPEGPSESVKSRIDSGAIDGYLVIAGDVVGGTGQATLFSKSRNVGDFEFSATVSGVVDSAVQQARFARNNLSPALIDELRKSVPFRQMEAGGGGGAKRPGMGVVMVPFIFMFLMFMGCFATGQLLLTSLIEEKSNRVMEVLLSSVSPMQLMAGKILGLAMAGLVLIAVWGCAGYAAAVSQGYTNIVSGMNVFYFLIYYVLGFFIFASMFAAAGSVCNSVKEAQNLIMPINIFAIAPMMVWMPITQDPNGTMATVMSFLPPCASTVMLLRIMSAHGVSTFQIVGSIVWLAICVVGFVWAAGKIFRTGVLMYGKAPTLPEVLKWLRYK